MKKHNINFIFFLNAQCLLYQSSEWDIFDLWSVGFIHTIERSVRKVAQQWLCSRVVNVSI